MSTLFNLRSEAFLEPQTTGCQAIHVCGWFAVAFSDLKELEVDTLVMVATVPPMAFAFAILFAIMVKISSKGYMLLMLKQAQV